MKLSSVSTHCTWRQSWPWMTRYFRSWNSFFIPATEVKYTDDVVYVKANISSISCFRANAQFRAIRLSNMQRLGVALGLPWSCLGCTHKPGKPWKASLKQLLHGFLVAVESWKGHLGSSTWCHAHGSCCCRRLENHHGCNEKISLAATLQVPSNTKNIFQVLSKSTGALASSLSNRMQLKASGLDL